MSMFALGAGILGAVSSLFGAKRAADDRRAEAEAVARAAEHNARIAEQHRQQAIAQGAEQARRTRVMNRKALGSMRAQYGASGLRFEGSPADVIAESEAAGELEAFSFEHQALLRGQAYARDRDLEQQRAGVAMRRSRASSVDLLMSGAAQAGGFLVRTGYFGG